MAKDLIRTARVRDIMHLLGIRPAAINRNADIRDMLTTLVKDPASRHVYVTDDDGRLIGSIRLNAVVEYIFPYEAFGRERMWENFFSSLYRETLDDFVNRDFRSVTEDTPLADMVRIMRREKVNELPVIDADGRLTGEVNMLKAVSYYLTLTAGDAHAHNQVHT